MVYIDGYDRKATPAKPAPLPIRVPPAAARPAASSATRSSGGSRRSSRGGGRSGGGGGGGNATSMASLQRKASNRYIGQANALEGQIKALKSSLNAGFRNALNQRLANIDLAQRQGIASITSGYNERYGSFQEAETSNTKAVAASSQQNLTNRNRERSQMLAEAMSQGAGESDVLRGQQVAINNWSQNQSEVSRSFFDTLSSINAGLTDLNVDTRTGYANVVSAAEGDRDAAWTNYYNQQSEGLVQLGNLYGQRAEYLGMANEQTTSGSTAARQRRATSASDAAFARASAMNGKAYRSPGEPGWLKKWTGKADFKSDVEARTFEQAQPKMQRLQGPQGATLRKWEG